MATINGTAGSDTLAGTAANDVINGLGADDKLSDAAGGKDTLDGGAGDDTLAGGIGNDTYIVDSNLDEVVEALGAGTDTVFASADFLLAENIENLTLVGNLGLAGTGNELDNIINGGSGDDNLNGVSGSDVLNGNGGKDVLVEDFGNNTMNGGDGDDVILAGLDSDTLNGGNGNDSLRSVGDGGDVMIGGKGDDEYFVDSAADKLTELANQGHDKVFSLVEAFSLAANLEDLDLASGISLNGTGNKLDNKITGNFNANVIDGADGNDFLTGDEDNDTLTGGAGDDTLDGGAGKDQMNGGTGNDVYVLTQLDEEYVESSGNDTVISDAGNLDLANFAQIENLTLTGGADLAATGNDVANKIIGNAGHNTLVGGAGNDTIDGGALNDQMKGGKGDDTYFVDDPNDFVFENDGEGKDVVFSTAAFWTIEVGQEIEALTLLGKGDIEGHGNYLANLITGNAGDNYLTGNFGNDTLIGGDGDDQLSGGPDDDVMKGGNGNDGYFVDSKGDVVTEKAGQGHDYVIVSHVTSYTLAANVEELGLKIGALDGNTVNATGNALDNIIYGNDVANQLNGATGNDTIYGGWEADTVIGGAGNDALNGNDFNDALRGDAGNDTLDGGVGADQMKGGAGNDKYIVDEIGDTVSEVGGSGVDEVTASVEYTLAAGLENLTLTGNAGIFGKGNDLSNRLTGNDGANTLTGFKGNDTLDGGAGEDTLEGGAGNDTYIVDETLDQVVEGAGGGKDTVICTADTYSLSSDVENLILKSSDPVTSIGTGNGLANNMVMQGAGDSFQLGGGGNDTITGGNGIDNLQGQADNDKLVGGAGDDTLDGGSGNDIMIGGAGSDFYVVDSMGDKLTEAVDKTSARDTVESHVTNFTLAANFEDLSLSTGAVNGTGNNLGNKITGFINDNVLTGGAGNDTLHGGGGDDTLHGGTGFDHLNGGFGTDVIFLDADGGQISFDQLEGPEFLADLGNDVIHGFDNSRDSIEIGALLFSLGLNDDPAGALADGSLVLTKSGDDTLLQIDFDKGGAGVPVTIATFVDVTVTIDAFGN